MASFFAKSKTSTRIPSKQPKSAVAGPSRIQTEFEKTFKPFVLKRDTQLAPVNWFVESKKSKSDPPPVMNLRDGVITIDEEGDSGKKSDLRMDGSPADEVNISQLSTQGL